MKFSKKQYQALLDALDIANTVYGIMGDMVDKKYNQHSDAMDELTHHVLGFASDYDAENDREEFQGRFVLTEERMGRPSEDLDEYEEYAFWDLLVRKLARRDMRRKYTEKQLAEMEEGDFMKELWEREEQYWKEFEKDDLDRFELKN